jgi:hypothetical protein
MAGRGPRRLNLGGVAILAGAAVTTYGAVQPWGPRGVDYGRDAVTSLALGGMLLLVGLATMVRPSSRLLSVVAVVLGSVVVAIVLRDVIELTEREPGAVRIGMYATGVGGLIAALGGLFGVRAAFFGGIGRSRR